MKSCDPGATELERIVKLIRSDVFVNRDLSNAGKLAVLKNIRNYAEDLIDEAAKTGGEDAPIAEQKERPE